MIPPRTPRGQLSSSLAAIEAQLQHQRDKVTHQSLACGPEMRLKQPNLGIRVDRYARLALGEGGQVFGELIAVGSIHSSAVLVTWL